MFFFAEGVSDELVLFGRAPYLKLAAFWTVQAGVWAVLTPLVVSLSHRFPIEQPLRVRNGFIHLGISLSLAVLAAAAVSVVAPRPMLGLMRRFGGSALGLAVAQMEGGFHQDVLAYWIILSVRHTLHYHGKFEERRQRTLQLELEASRLQVQVVEAQLAALRMRLDPVFLLTTIADTQVLIRQQHREGAEAMLSSLSDLVRCLIADPDANVIVLQDELEHARLYLAIEHLRLGDRLQIRVSADDDTLDLPVPRVSLRPLLEAAVRGVKGSRASMAIVGISAWRSRHSLRLRVSCDMNDEAPALSDAFATALATTKARLMATYGDAFELTVARDHETFAVTMSLPYQCADQTGNVRLRLG